MGADGRLSAQQRKGEAETEKKSPPLTQQGTGDGGGEPQKVLMKRTKDRACRQPLEKIPIG